MTELDPAHAVAAVAAGLTKPIAVQTLVRQALELTGPDIATQTIIDHAYQSRDLIFVDEATLVATAMIFDGAWFRVPLDEIAIESGLVRSRWFYPFFDPELQTATLSDVSGKPIAAPFIQFDDPQADGFSLGAQLAAWQVRPGDSLLAQIESWRAGRYRLTPERVERQDTAAMAARDLQVRTLIRALSARYPEQALIPLWHIIPRVYAAWPERNGYPGRHYVHVLRSMPDLRMVGGHSLAASTLRRPLDDLVTQVSAPWQTLTTLELALQQDIAEYHAWRAAQAFTPAETIASSPMAQRPARGRTIKPHGAPADLAAYLASSDAAPEDGPVLRHFTAFLQHGDGAWSADDAERYLRWRMRHMAAPPDGALSSLPTFIRYAKFLDEHGATTGNLAAALTQRQTSLERFLSLYQRIPVLSERFTALADMLETRGDEGGREETRGDEGGRDEGDKG